MADRDLFGDGSPTHAPANRTLFQPFPDMKAGGAPTVAGSSGGVLANSMDESMLLGAPVHQPSGAVVPASTAAAAPVIGGGGGVPPASPYLANSGVEDVPIDGGKQKSADAAPVTAAAAGPVGAAATGAATPASPSAGATAAAAAAASDASASSSAAAASVSGARIVLGPTVRRFEVLVSDPEKKGDGLMNQYTSYKLLTKIDGGSGHSKTNSVVRRFNDFAWLHSQLEAKYRGCLIPPVHDKHYMGRFDSDFIDERKRALETFLARIAVHPDLSKSQDVELFLLGDDEALAKAKSGKDDKKESKGFMGMMSKAAQSISHAFSSKEREKSSDDVACEKIVTYASGLEAQLGLLQAKIDALTAKTKEFGSVWFEFGSVCNETGQYETAAKEAELASAFTRLSDAANKVSLLFFKLREDETVHFVEPFKDYIRVVKAVQAMLVVRATVLRSYNQSLGVLESRQADLAKVSGVAGREAKQATLEKSVTEAQANVERAGAELKQVTAGCMAEVHRFRAEKYRDLKTRIRDFVAKQIEMCHKVQAAWESVLPELDSLP
jgi:sorting nexin-1/2